MWERYIDGKERTLKWVINKKGQKERKCLRTQGLV